MILNQTLNPAERKGMANNLGFYNDTTGDGDYTSNICQPINTAIAGYNRLPTGGKSWSFAIPLIGLLNAVKFIPLFNGDFTVELTVNALSSWLQSNTTAGSAAISTITLL